MCYDSKENLIYYYDPLKSNKYLKEILKSFLKFAKTQAELSKQNMTQMNFQEMSYHKSNILDDFNEEDSALYMLKLIHSISVAGRQEARANELQKFRRELLQLLFQYGAI